MENFENIEDVEELYTPEQMLIRNTCLNNRKEALSFIEKENWDLVQNYTCVEDCSVCNDHRMGKIKDYIINCMIVCVREFNLDIQKTIERIDGNMNHEKWFLAIMKDPPHFKSLTYFIKNKLIHPNYSNEVTLFSLYGVYMCGYYWKNTFEFILSETGFNINLQDIYGDNILLSILKKNYYDNQDFIPEERHDYLIHNYNQKILYLLQNGADPLLENKEGLSAIEYARNLQTFLQSQKEELIKLLEVFC